MYQFKSRVRFSEVDSQLNMTLPSIINYFQDCSTFHSDSIGQGIEVIMAQGYAWILSSWQIIINRYPRFGEEITISTWAHGWKAFFGYRNFKMEDANGNVHKLDLHEYQNRTPGTDSKRDQRPIRL